MSIFIRHMFVFMMDSRKCLIIHGRFVCHQQHLTMSRNASDIIIYLNSAEGKKQNYIRLINNDCHSPYYRTMHRQYNTSFDTKKNSQ